MKLWQGIKNRFRPLYLIWIVVLWCLMMGEVTWANLIGGLLIGLVVIFALPLPAMPTRGIRLSLPRLLAFLGIWLKDLAFASVKVSWLALRPAAPPKTAILRVPMRVSNEFVLYFATCAYNLQPGGSVSDIDIANRIWTIHVLDADDEEDLNREIQNVADLERRMIKIFEGA
ncbi:MAG TPA: Na+/H+ antiporter subunit E [Corynebacterium sp.]|nr:Na+/H+ antiporter subunit E [Corynebacterium sp.]